MDEMGFRKIGEGDEPFYQCLMCFCVVLAEYPQEFQKAKIDDPLMHHRKNCAGWLNT